MTDWYDNPPLPSLDVPEHKPIDTGLVDRFGNAIKRHPREIGFHRPRPRK